MNNIEIPVDTNPENGVKIPQNKTSRKNKTKQTMNWPSQDEYFTIDKLVEMNKHMLTDVGSDITIRVRLKKASEEEQLVTKIGERNYGKGRPQNVYAVRPISQKALDKANEDGVRLMDPTKLVTIMKINTTFSTNDQNPVSIPITKILSSPTISIPTSMINNNKDMSNPQRPFQTAVEKMLSSHQKVTSMNYGN